MTSSDWEYKQTGWTRQALLVILMEAALGSVTDELRAISFLVEEGEIEIALHVKRLTPELQERAKFIFGYFLSTSAITDFRRSIHVGSDPLPFLSFPSAYTLLSREAAS